LLTAADPRDVVAPDFHPPKIRLLPELNDYE